MVAHVHADHVVKIDHTVLEQRSLYNLPTGRVLVANAMPADRADVVAAHGYPGKEWDGIEDEAGLIAACKKIQRQGECVMLETAKEVTSLAVLVSNHASPSGLLPSRATSVLLGDDYRAGRLAPARPNSAHATCSSNRPPLDVPPGNVATASTRRHAHLSGSAARGHSSE